MCKFVCIHVFLSFAPTELHAAVFVMFARSYLFFSILTKKADRGFVLQCIYCRILLVNPYRIISTTSSFAEKSALKLSNCNYAKNNLTPPGFKNKKYLLMLCYLAESSLHFEIWRRYECFFGIFSLNNNLIGTS